MGTPLLEAAAARAAVGDYQASLGFITQAIAALRANSPASDLDLAMALNIRGECERHLGQLTVAMASYDEAWTHARRANDPALKATIAGNRGIGFLSQGRIDEAIASQRIALDLDLERGDLEDIGYSRHNLGAALARGGKPVEAVREIAQAAEIRRRIGDWDELLSSLTMQANLAMELRDERQAKAAIHEALQLEGRLSNKAALRHPLLVAADISILEGDHRSALSALEAASSIVEQMRVRAADEAAFDQRYYEYYARVIEALFRLDRDDDAIALIDQTRARVLDAQEATRSGDKVGRLSGMPLRLEIGKRLGPDEAMVEMWLYRGSLRSFVSDAEGFSTHYTAHVGKVDSRTTLDDLLSDGALTTADGEAFNSSFLAALSDRASSWRRLYLVPHGVQFQLPLASVRTEGGRYLGQDLEIAIVPSARSWLWLHERIAHPQSKCLVIGDPDGTLPYARQEAQMVGDALGVKPILGRDASAERVLRLLAKETYDIVHFACHFASTENAALSGLMMANGELITAAQIARIGLRSNLVCTASCASGLVPFSPSNELGGFNGALLRGGANAIVSSIAPLHDGASALFFKRFYGVHRKRGAELSEAFAASQRDLMSSDDFAAPRYWAPLYLTGAK